VGTPVHGSSGSEREDIPPEIDLHILKRPPRAETSRWALAGKPNGLPTFRSAEDQSRTKRWYLSAIRLASPVCGKPSRKENLGVLLLRAKKV